MSDMQVLTPKDIKNLPKCKWAFFGKCREDQGKRYDCLLCLLEDTCHSLVDENLAGAMLYLDAAVLVLKDRGAIPK